MVVDLFTLIQTLINHLQKLLLYASMVQLVQTYYMQSINS